MKTWALRNVFLSGVATLLAAGAQATTYYVSDCQAGADADCVAGNDANAGTSAAAPWQTYNKAYSKFVSMPGGNSVLLARGGSFIGVEKNWSNGSCSTGAPCILADYTPPWASGDESRPILLGSGQHFFHFVTGGGYEVRNLALEGPGAGSSWAVVPEVGVNGLVLDNLLIEKFEIAFYGGDPAPTNVTVRNCRIIHNSMHGWLGGTINGLVENNYFEDNGTRSILDHNMYFSDGSDTVIRNNEFYKAAMGGGAQCQAVSLVVHGVSPRLTIEGNYVHEDIGGAQQGCWGIGVDPGWATGEDFSGTVIRGNRIVNVGNAAIALTSCPNCVVEDNVIINEQPYAITAISVPDRTPGAGDSLDTNITVRNNSIYINTTSGGSVGIRVGNEGGGSPFDNGTNYVVVSNAIYETGSSAFSCFELNLPAASYAAVNNNVCGFPAGGKWQGSSSLAAWQGATGLDANSLAVNPQFTAPAGPSWDLSLSTTSPAANAGHLTLSAPTDFNGQTRDALPDVGAFEVSTVTPPSPPTAPGTPSLTALSSSQIKLNWTDAAGETSYRIERSLNNVTFSTAISALTANTITYTDPGLLASTTYYYRVAAKNAAGETMSGVSSARTLGPAVTPAGLTPPPGLKEAYAYPNPAKGVDPVIRAMMGGVDSVEITIFDQAGQAVKSDRVTTTITVNGEPAYEYKWTGEKPSGVYYAVIHGKKGNETIRARASFAVMK